MDVFPQITSPPQAQAEVIVNNNLAAVRYAGVYAMDPLASTGFIWSYLGGRWSGAAIAAGSLTLTASSTNYIVVARATGAISVSTNNTNWLDQANYARVYLVPTDSASWIAASLEDHRAGGGGVQGSSGPALTPGPVTSVASLTGIISAAALKTALAYLADINVWTKNQSVQVATLADASTIATDASTSNNFTVTLGGNRALANPTNLTAGMWLHWTIVQDGTGGRTLTFGSMFKWPSASPPTLSTAAGAIDTISAYYDGALLLATSAVGFA